MKILNDIKNMTSFRLAPIKRDVFEIFWPLFYSLLPLVAFILFIGWENIQQVGDVYGMLVGAIVTSVTLIPLIGIPLEFMIEREDKIKDLFVALPIKPIVYSVSTALSRLPVNLPAVLIYFIILGFSGFFNVLSFVLTLLVLSLLFITNCVLGSYLAVVFRRLSLVAANSIIQIISLVFTYFLPVYYPDSRWGQLRYLSWLFPTSNTASLIKNFLSIEPETLINIFIKLGILIVVNLVLIIILFKQEWREK